MKIADIAPPEYEKPGTYAGVRFGPGTVELLTNYCKENKIPNCVKPDDFHSTVLFSTKNLPNYKPEGKFPTPMVAIPTGFEIWPSQKDDDGKVENCLVLTFDCARLYHLHHKLMQQHGATYSFDQYQPHVTLSYDIGKMKINKLPEITDKLEIVSDYTSELDPNWAKKKKK